tara:strand:+ start:3120 stop:3317 length:198 start_codon:yes stop_codon:yes gene_type:complete
MTSGNDILEYEEENEEMLLLEFVKDRLEKFNNYAWENYEVLTGFKNERLDEWDEFVMDSYVNRHS